MNIILKTAAVLVIALLVASCGDNGNGNGGNGDEAAIEDMVREFMDAFEDGDADKMAGLFSAECATAADDVAAALDLFEEIDVEFDVTGVDIRNLEEDSAEVAPQGTGSIAGEEEPLGGEGDYSRVVKEDGEWRMADCGFFQ